MGQTQSKNNDQALESRQYQYEQEKETDKQKIGPGREFSFSFGKKQDIPKRLKLPRSSNYIEAVQAADLLTANDEAIIAKLKENMDEDAVEELAEMSAEELAEELMRSVREELETALEEMREAADNTLLGVLSKCYIGGCDVHAISCEGCILNHFKTSEGLPDGMEAGRKVFHQYPDCSCVEVYGKYCLVIDYDGTVTQVQNN